MTLSQMDCYVHVE